MAKEFDLEEVAYWFGIAVVGYAVINYIRDLTTTDSGGAVFGSSAPTYGAVDSAIDILAPMEASPNGLNFIMQAEGFSPSAKNDNGHRMIGYGHDIVAGENFSGPISKSQAYQILLQDAGNAASALNQTLMVPVTQNQFDALVSWTYNVGVGAMEKSTLISKLNNRDYAGAAQEFQRWDISAGRQNAGLSNRRSGEQQMFNS